MTDVFSNLQNYNMDKIHDYMFIVQLSNDHSDIILFDSVKFKFVKCNHLNQYVKYLLTIDEAIDQGYITAEEYKNSLKNVIMQYVNSLTIDDSNKHNIECVIVEVINNMNRFYSNHIK